MDAINPGEMLFDALHRPVGVVAEVTEDEIRLRRHGRIVIGDLVTGRASGGVAPDEKGTGEVVWTDGETVMIDWR